MYCKKANFPKHIDSNQLIIYISAENAAIKKFNPFGSFLKKDDCLFINLKYGDNDSITFCEYGFLYPPFLSSGGK